MAGRSLGWPTTNGWTGGQYSLYRVALAVAFAAWALRAPWMSFVSGLALVGAAALLAPGVLHRVVAGSLMAAVLALSPGHPAAWLWLLPLAAHLASPSAPYGSWPARGRVDPGGGWILPGWITAAVWGVALGGHALAGLQALWRPEAAWDPLLEIAGPGAALGFVLAAPLALWPAARPWLWTGLLVSDGLRLALEPDPGWLPALVLAHLMLFDPAWIPGRSGSRERIFFDGHCALCHGAVRFLLAEDRHEVFRFAPLQGAQFSSLPEEVRRDLPDSLVLSSKTGLVTRSEAVLQALGRLGGIWRPLSVLVRVVPRPLRDAAYRGVAKVRYRVFGRRPEVCPLMPPALRSRFDLEL